MAQRFESWLLLSEENIRSYIALPNFTWPFNRISESQFFELYGTIGDKHLDQKTLRLYASVICALGFILTALLIGTLWRKTFVEKNTFYRAMMVVSVFDLAFNLLGLPMNICHRTFRISGSTSHDAMRILILIRGLNFVVGLASDICTVILTLERYLAVDKPQLHKTLLDNQQRLVRVCCILAVFVVSMTRIHFCMDLSVDMIGSTNVYIKSDFGTTPFVVGLTILSDSVLPILLLIAMAVLSSLFRNAVSKRQRRKPEKVVVASISHEVTETILRPPDTQAHDQPPAAAIVLPPATTPRTADVGRDLRSVLVLTLSLDALFMLNQAGYCVYTAAEFLLAKNHITYDSSYEEVAGWISANRFENYANIITSVVECASHAVNFPLYIALSSSMRKEFVGFLRRLV